MFATNLDGVFHVFQAAARHMTERATAGDPFGRFGEPADFGGIAVYLMSNASSYHTADCFVIDGGYTAF
jgi:NAD(P)-dependent dehydrogenase (short-subunit alcohol dehydrogenase family)